MVSFTNKFAILFASGAFIALLSYIFPWAMAVAAIYVSTLVWLAVFDYYLTKPNLTARREFDSRAGLGRPAQIRLIFTNAARYKLYIEVEDTPPKGCGIGINRLSASVPPGGGAEAAYSVSATKRGDKKFGPLFVRIRGRLGLIRKRVILTPAEDTLRVFPDMAELHKYELLVRKGYFYMPGMRPSKFRGRGTVFETMRDYQPDDDFQRINWKATARLARPVVMEYEMEKNQNVFLMIDTGRLMGLDVFDLSKLDHALRAALVLSGVCSLKGDNVGLLCFSGEVNGYLPPAHGRRQLTMAMDMLYNLEPSEDESDYSKAFEFLLAKKLKRSLIVVFSDFVDMYASETLVRHLSRLRPAHLPVCVTLRDSNIEDAAAETPGDLRGVYRKTAAYSMLERRNAVFHNLSRRGVNVINARPEQLSSDLINKYLELKSRLAF